MAQRFLKILKAAHEWASQAVQAENYKAKLQSPQERALYEAVHDIEPDATLVALHVDDWIDDFDSDPYASFVLQLFRMPAAWQMRWERWIKQHRLFCTFEGKRWRVTGASRMGDVWLAEDFSRESGYDKRVDVTACSAWGKEA